MAKSLKLYLSALFFVLVSIYSYGQEKIKDKQAYLDFAYRNYPQTSKEYRAHIEYAIKVFPEDAQLRREVATSYFKAGEYAPAMKYINKAVELDPKSWLGYRAFMKCIFMKDYANAIQDFKQALTLKNGYYEMDHTYHFYIAISYLKLNQLDSADNYMRQSLQLQMPDGKGSGHHLDWFYWGLIKHQQKNYNKAIEYYDKSLGLFSQFPDPLYYKALILRKKKKHKEANESLEKAEEALKQGYKINEDNEVYVNYPFQITLHEVQEALKIRP
ncbi:MAG: hypothetical protein EAZ32_13390 [Cytophagia bacterium]|nr:MAG: hypothetical protein EAZ38_14400 [Cytophagales bacterium]TAG38099.1 MAG: hypothetical protein EAZ32_13390 [Cytophagia bacterium]TAG79530.1 MAG: hypothetical protein EAZ22_11355 [Cytophagales bacterium]